MVNYKCPRCGFNTNIKTKYTSHLKRKYICEPKISDVNLTNEYIKYNIQNKIISPKSTEIGGISTKNTEIGGNFTKNTDKNSLFECEFCYKIFSRNDSLIRHQKGRCKNMDNDNNDMKELVKLLNDQLKEQQNQIMEQNNQIKELIKKAGITNINIQNNIKLLSYGNTDVSHLTDNDYMKCLNHSNFCVPHLIEKIHFNPQKPENHNIYISNIKNNYVMLYDGDKWILKDRDEAITNLLDEKEVILEQKLEEWIENGNDYPKIMNKFKRYIDKKENNKVLNKIKDEIKLVLFNNRQFVEKK